MNTNDFTPVKGLTFEEIFEKQKPLMVDYEPELGERVKEFDINILEDQELFKSFLLVRFVEELTEATVDLEHEDHFEEEIIDAFNFLVETYLLYGWQYSDLDPWEDGKGTGLKIDPINKDEIDLHTYRVVEQTGLSCNYLKNRKWRSTQYLVDLLFFEEDFKKIWNKFNDLCNVTGISQARLLELWSLKYQVNEFRLETKY